jgi:prepilin-type N-terminal cleavage/methylation domain-containing protein
VAVERTGMGGGLTAMQRDNSGFSLIETIIALGILATGLLGMAGVFTLGMAHMATSSANLIAREKAREAVESVHTARDTRTIGWCQIYNVSSVRTSDCDGTPAGVFLDAAQVVKDPGADGLVNTADDGAVAEQRLPGPNGTLGDSDDIHIPLTNFTRTVTITNVMDGTTPNASLKQIVVTINYSVGKIKRTYVLTTYVSSIS